MIVNNKKYCPKCKTEKPLDDFGKAKSRSDGLRGWCKECTNKATSEWQRKNPEKLRARKKRFYEMHPNYEQEYYIQNAEKIKERSRKWYKNNKKWALKNSKKWAEQNLEKTLEMKNNWKKRNAEAVKKYNKQYRIDNRERRRNYNKLWRKENLDKAREMGRKNTAKRLATPKGKLSSNISREIRASIGVNTKRNRHWEKFVDFTIDQLKTHLEKLFKPGMTWDNYGTVWHIDHKIPIAAFNFERPEDIDFRLCWSLKNLQPLEAKVNMSKGARLERDFQPSLALAV